MPCCGAFLEAETVLRQGAAADCCNRKCQQGARTASACDGDETQHAVLPAMTFWWHQPPAAFSRACGEGRGSYLVTHVCRHATHRRVRMQAVGMSAILIATAHGTPPANMHRSKAYFDLHTIPVSRNYRGERSERNGCVPWSDQYFNDFTPDQKQWSHLMPPGGDAPR
jgi:hypothetical protein